MKAAIFWILLFPSFLFTINAQSAEAAPYQHPESSTFSNHFKETIQEIFEAEKAGHYKDVKLLQVRTIPLAQALSASLTYTQGDERRLSKLYLLVYKQHFLKIRLTYDGNVKAHAEEALSAFCNQIGKKLRCN